MLSRVWYASPRTDPWAGDVPPAWVVIQPSSREWEYPSENWYTIVFYFPGEGAEVRIFRRYLWVALEATGCVYECSAGVEPFLASSRLAAAPEDGPRG